jgi:hypothetical protein
MDQLYWEGTVIVFYLNKIPDSDAHSMHSKPPSMNILLRMKDLENNEKEEYLMCQLQQFPHREGIRRQLKSVDHDINVYYFMIHTMQRLYQRGDAVDLKA